MDEVKGGGWLFFAGTITLIAGVLNGIRGFALIGSANFRGGGELGRWIGISGRSISAIGALLSIKPGAAGRRAPGWG